LKESLQSARQVVDTATNILSAARQKTTQTKTAVRARLGTEYETKIVSLQVLFVNFVLHLLAIATVGQPLP